MRFSFRLSSWRKHMVKYKCITPCVTGGIRYAEGDTLELEDGVKAPRHFVPATIRQVTVAPEVKPDPEPEAEPENKPKGKGK